MAGEEDLEWWEHADVAAMAAELAGDLSFLIGQAVEGHGSARVALPTDPRTGPVLAALAEEAVDWSRVTVLPTDMADSDHELLSSLLAPLGATVAPLDPAAAPPVPFDVVWLTTDDSGAVAGIAAGPDMTPALMTPRGLMEVAGDSTAPRRLTLTKSALLTGRAIVMTVFGDQERALLERAIADGAGSPYPVGRLLADAAQAIDIHWCP